MTCISWRDRPWWMKLLPLRHPHGRNPVIVMPRPGIPGRKRNDLREAIEQWENDNDGAGYYWLDNYVPPEMFLTHDAIMNHGVPFEESGWVLYFTHPDTAFSFKMRFG